MKNKTKIICIAGGLVLLPLVSHAGQVRDREATQQHRIARGIHSGQITAAGASHLETRESRINRSRTADLRANGGHLTAAEHHSLNRRESNLSGHIYARKHNVATQPGVGPHGSPGTVVGREATQQRRIAQGVASGQITAAGAASLENRERALNQSRVADRTGNGGALTPGQHAGLDQQANGVSHQIYTDKHNQPTQPGVPAQ
jgi:hypothetical protein